MNDSVVCLWCGNTFSVEVEEKETVSCPFCAGALVVTVVKFMLVAEHHGEKEEVGR